jgi:hypothetical protein
VADADLLRGLRGFDGRRHDPVALARTVNRLVLLPLGQTEETLRELARHAARGQAEPDDVLLVCRALFLPVAEGRLPELRVGRPQPDPGELAQRLPAYPIAVELDVPFLLVTGFLLGGEAESPADHLERCLRTCVRRNRPLRPADDPLQAAGALAARLGLGDQEPGRELRELLELQAGNAVASPVYDDGGARPT